MSDLVIGALIITAVFALVPVVWAIRLCVYYWWHSGPTPATAGYRPVAAVILPLRGADPSLVACVRGLLRQDYPNYFVYIVVDSETDPAWEILKPVLAERHAESVTLRVSTLRHRHETCGLKVSAQLQALGELDERVEVVCFIDADSVPAADWLAAMVAPLADARVGAATGFRWFAPEEPTLANLVRYVYNAGSFVQMHVFHIPWGGSLALRKETLVRSDLPQHWSRCFCEDTATYGALRRLGLRIVGVPAATQINREAIDMEGAKRFILRQLLCVRLHHVHWQSLLALNCANAAALIFAGFMVLAGAILMKPAWVLAFGGVLAAFAVGQLGALLSGEWLIRGNVRSRTEPLPPFTFGWNGIRAALLAQSLGFQGLIASLFLRQIDWRGILYAIDGTDQIRLLEYRPYDRAPQGLDQSVV